MVTPDGDRSGRRPRARTDDRIAGPSRGQLLLAGAFVLAVGIIGLTFVLNTSVQTNTLAESETGIARGGDALAARQAVRADIGDFLTALNRAYDEDGGATDPWHEYRDAFRAGVPPLARGVRDHHATGGRLVNVTAPSALATAFEDGFRVKQETTDSFAKPATRTAVDPVGQWRVVRDSRVRNATFRFEREVSTSDPAFRVVFEESASGDEWAIEVFEQPTTPGNWRLEVQFEGSTVDSCTGPPRSNAVRLDVDDARFGGDYCPALSRLDPEPTYTVEFRNGDNVRGQFWMLVDRQRPDGPPSSGLPPAVGPQVGIDSTEYERALYGVQVAFRYHSSTVDYETDLVIAPGEI